MIKDESQFAAVQEVCTTGLNLFRVLMIYLTPVVPSLADDARNLFQESEWRWDSARQALLDRDIAAFKPLITRVEQSQVDTIVEQSRQT